MKTHCLLISLLSACNFCYAQNLVPNPGFENFTTCPYMHNQLSFAWPWYNPTTLTPDYYNACATNTSVWTPNNNGGTQIPFSGGAYAGVYASQLSSAQNVREYIRVQLIQPLQSGVIYRVKFHVSLVDICDYGISSFGAYFSVSNTAPMNGYIMNVVPQVQNNPSNPLISKINWMPVEGIFTAAGNEQYITLGNFNNEANSGYYSLPGFSHHIAYYLIDDVSVIPDSLTVIEENYSEFETNIFPNPFYDKLMIINQTNELSVINLYDMNGRLLLNMEFMNSVSLSTEHLRNGIYIYQLIGKNGVVNYGKVLKE